MKPTPGTMRQIRKLLEEVARYDTDPLRSAQAETLAARIAPPRKAKKSLPFKGRKERKAERRSAHRMSTAEIRAAVRARAAGVCEGCGERWGFRGWEMDHWLGGSGRRREQQSVANCWALCGTSYSCSSQRTANIPTAEFWNARFKAHCEKYGYPFVPHVVHAPVPRRA